MRSGSDPAVPGPDGRCATPGPVRYITKAGQPPAQPPPQPTDSSFDDRSIREKPFAGIRILDFTAISPGRSGPTSWLLGAEVIKIEPKSETRCALRS
jgi:hypothetical protein